MNENISAQSISYIKKNYKQIVAKYANRDIFKPVKSPISIFMAGSPGAGKTEFSKSLINRLVKERGHQPIVRIDPDEIREFIPFYNGSNSDEIQSAASIGVEKLFDYVQDKKLNMLLDGTLSNYQIAEKDISRAIGRRRQVGVFFIYQDPVIAWNFTQKREKLEGRVIPKEAFIKALFQSYKNVDLLKEKFNSKIELNLVVKQIDNRIENAYFNIRRVADFLEIEYTPPLLEKKLILLKC